MHVFIKMGQRRKEVRRENVRQVNKGKSSQGGVGGAEQKRRMRDKRERETGREKQK